MWIILKIVFLNQSFWLVSHYHHLIQLVFKTLHSIVKGGVWNDLCKLLFQFDIQTKMWGWQTGLKNISKLKFIIFLSFFPLLVSSLNFISSDRFGLQYSIRTIKDRAKSVISENLNILCDYEQMYKIYKEYKICRKMYKNLKNFSTN